MPRTFEVVIPSFNNAPWCRRNLESVLTQDYPLFRVTYVDDASADETPRLVAEYLADETTPHRDRVTFHRNSARVGPVANIDRVVRDCDPNAIVVLVDGDDLLAHPHVLRRLDEIYEDPDVWLTWGQFTRFPQDTEGFCAPIPAEIVSANAFRDYPFVSSHLRTFYAGLYQRIRPVDLQDRSGRFFMTAGDVAQMWAMHEMAGPHGRFVDEVLYLYNRENPLNDDKVDREGQLRVEAEIRGRARYGRARRLGDAPRELCVVPGPDRTLFESTDPLTAVDQRCDPFRQMRAVLNRLGYTVRETQVPLEIDDPHTVVVFDVRPDEIDSLAALPSDVLNLVLWQDPVTNPHNFDARHHGPFGRVYTWNDDLVDNVRYFKLSFPFLRQMIADLVPFEQRKLCALVASNNHSDHPDELYSEERKIAEYFTREDGDSFDLFGWGWGPALDRNSAENVPGRVELLRRYRFSFCYETIKGWSGFVTGKIFDSFRAGCVPVYRGAPDIAKSIPRDCFIAREDFDSEEALHAFLRGMPAATHDEYLNRIRAFLASDAAVQFSAEQFVRTFVELVARRSASSAVAA